MKSYPVSENKGIRNGPRVVYLSQIIYITQSFTYSSTDRDTPRSYGRSRVRYRTSQITVIRTHEPYQSSIANFCYPRKGYHNLILIFVVILEYPKIFIHI